MMSRQLYAAKSTHGRRSFSSASDICGLNRCRPRSPVMSKLGGRSRVGGYSAKSLSSVVGSRRISHSRSYKIGGQVYGEIYYGSPRNYIELRNYAGGYQNGHLLGVSVNEPLGVGVDPEIQKIHIQEREQMKSPNTQFACFIDKVQCLEQKNRVLVAKWNLLQEQRPPIKRDLQPLFENSVGGLRKQLEFLLSEKGKRGQQLQNTQQCLEEFKRKYEEVINRCAAAENVFVSLKKDVDRSFMNKKELEAQVAALKMEIEFLKYVYDEELSQLDQQIQCKTSVAVEMDNSQRLDMNCILQNFDSWYQNFVQGSKEEVNALYRSRFQELQNKRRHINDDLKLNKCEAAELHRITQRMLCDLGKAMKQVACLQSAVLDTEHQGNINLKDAQEKLDELHSALQKSKDELAGRLRNYQELLNDKLALDIEIATYKSLLEGEENRLISGNLVNVAVVPNPSKAAGDTSSEPVCGSLSGGVSSKNGKYNRGCPGMGQTHGNVDCYPVGPASRSVGNPCIPGHNSTSGGNASKSAQRPRCTNCGTGRDTTTSAARYQGGQPGTGNVAGACSHHGLSCQSGPSFCIDSRI